MFVKYFIFSGSIQTNDKDCGVHIVQMATSMLEIWSLADDEKLTKIKNAYDPVRAETSMRKKMLEKFIEKVDWSKKALNSVPRQYLLFRKHVSFLFLSKINYFINMSQLCSCQYCNIDTSDFSEINLKFQWKKSSVFSFSGDASGFCEC